MEHFYSAAGQTRQEAGVRISLIAAIGQNREIGKGGDLLWRIPEDMKRFKELTMNHPVIMGRKTWESIPEKYRPLPGRTNIVVTHQLGFNAPGAKVAHSLEEAFEIAFDATGAEEIFVAGGAEIYRKTLGEAHRLYLTLIADEKDADSFFPSYESSFRETSRGDWQKSGDIPYCFLVLEHKHK